MTSKICKVQRAKKVLNEVPNEKDHEKYTATGQRPFSDGYLAFSFGRKGDEFYVIARGG